MKFSSEGKVPKNMKIQKESIVKELENLASHLKVQHQKIAKK